MGRVSSQPTPAEKFAAEYDIDIYADIKRMGMLLPCLAQLDSVGRTELHITDDSGADYYLSRIDYYRNAVEVRASRVIAKIKAGHRTKLAYWTKVASNKQLTIHRGEGYFIIGSPQQDDSTNAFDTTIFRIDPEVTPTVTLSSGQFYTFEAAVWSPEPLVVSGLCETDLEGNWEAMEISIEPGQDIVEAPEGIVEVPNEFMMAQFN